MKIVSIYLFFLAFLGHFSWANGQEKCIAIDLASKANDADAYFVGALFPEKTRIELKKIQDAIKAESRQFLPSLPQKLHVTLKFVGVVSPQDREKLTQILSSMFENIHVASMTMKPEELMLLTRWKDKGPRLVILKVDSPALHKLFADIEDQLENFCQRDSRPYLAHVTLGTYHFKADQNLTPVIEEKLKSIPIEKNDLTVGEMKVMSVPKAIGDRQYLDAKDYDTIYQFATPQ